MQDRDQGWRRHTWLNSAGERDNVPGFSMGALGGCLSRARPSSGGKVRVRQMHGGGMSFNSNSSVHTAGTVHRYNLTQMRWPDLKRLAPVFRIVSWVDRFLGEK